MNLRFKVHGSLKGGFPLEDQEYDFVNGEDYYQELINLISQAEEEKALDLAKKEFGAEFIIENIEAFEEVFEFVETESVSLKSPFIEEIDGIKIYGNAPNRGGVITFNIDNIHSHDLAQIVNNDKIAIRAGHHCAQPIMNKLNVSSTARVSFYFYNTFDEIDLLCNSLKKAINLFK